MGGGDLLTFGEKIEISMYLRIDAQKLFRENSEENLGIRVLH